MKKGIIIPVKELRECKARLAPILSEPEREELTIIMYSDLVKRIRNSSQVDEILTVTPDKLVAEHGKSLGSSILLEESSEGVNIAVAKGTNYYSTRNFDCTLILPADIPLINTAELENIFELALDNDVILTPSLNKDGTNALLRRPPDVMRTFYDDDSFRNHVRETQKRKLKISIFEAPSIMLDLDSPFDALKVASAGPTSPTGQFLKRISFEGRFHDTQH